MDFDAHMKEIQQNLSELLKEEAKSNAELQQLFENIGYKLNM